MSQASLDSNTWYLFSDARVTNTTGPVIGCLQQTSNGLRTYSCDDKETMAWQFQPVNSTKGRYLIRSNATGVRLQLSACWDQAETANGHTAVCMRRTTSGESQMWDILDWGDGTFDLFNAANGSDYIVDRHAGSGVFMSDQIAGSAVSDSVDVPGQRWIIRGDRAVNDPAYSCPLFITETNYSGLRLDLQEEPSSTSTAASLPNTERGSSRGLSSETIAGITVGIALGVICLIAMMLFLSRRRKLNHGARLSGSHQQKFIFSFYDKRRPVIDQHAIESGVHQATNVQEMSSSVQVA
ncbi:transmembrane alpha-helix domain-containing protein [Colletotrichum paranaense]|uniref:Transmembrane alpha-helix domain-containing protein n=1 Tax=Colletotrichum paranaense TaxID=1914294 RepID=A0ABQ9SW47_9PEZI|nr:transmembrane alpha-helix domain-containing protein [Colletotrichum paranaense]KAK1543733.1 transmembrane alpha-helix domain-containing protein [Colletotrichum paranaense]